MTPTAPLVAPLAALFAAASTPLDGIAPAVLLAIGLYIAWIFLTGERHNGPR